MPVLHRHEHITTSPTKGGKDLNGARERLFTTNNFQESFNRRILLKIN